MATRKTGDTYPSKAARLPDNGYPIIINTIGMLCVDGAQQICDPGLESSTRFQTDRTRSRGIRWQTKPPAFSAFLRSGG